jgi:hypothetical protein
VQYRARDRSGQGLAVTERIDRVLVAVHDRRQRGEMETR